MMSFIPNWHNLLKDQLDQFVNTGFLVLDHCFDPSFVKALQQESGFLDYQQAMLTQGELLTNVRGDRIRWIDDSCPIGTQYLQAMEHLAQFFNQYLFAGIRRWEAHYACYPVGFGYQWHMDNPVGRDERVISAVYYLNDDWQTQDGGAIELVDKLAQSHVLLPKANRLLLFDSQLRHQVQIAHRQRFSIATWFRRDHDVF